MIRTKHVFRQDVPCLQYAALGDTAVRVLSVHYLITRYNLDALVVPQPNPTLIPLWETVLRPERIVRNPNDIPPEFRLAQVSAPTELDWRYGSAGWNVFESVMWENGFFNTGHMRIIPPIVFHCAPRAKAVMVFPNEVTDGNRVFDSRWWIQSCRQLRAGGYSLNLLGNRTHQALLELYAEVKFDREFEPTLDGLRQCVAESSLAIGGSTGPTWTLLFSDIPQIVLESHRSPHGYWHFDRCQTVLGKKLNVIATIECLSAIV